jgi:hypothetical protein
MKTLNKAIILAAALTILVPTIALAQRVLPEDSMTKSEYQAAWQAEMDHRQREYESRRDLQRSIDKQEANNAEARRQEERAADKRSDGFNRALESRL